jgi:hypothetical protein
MQRQGFIGLPVDCHQDLEWPVVVVPGLALAYDGARLLI